MKKNLTPLLVLITVLSLTMNLFSCAPSNHATADAKTDSVSAWVQNNKWVFHAQTALPQRGSAFPIMGNYTFELSPDSCVAFLPYFGRAYTAPIDPTNGGIKFTSKKYTKDVSFKKNTWTIKLTPQDQPAFQSATPVQNIYVTIGKSGYGSVQVISQSRDQISFNGYFSQEQL